MEVTKTTVVASSDGLQAATGTIRSEYANLLKAQREVVIKAMGIGDRFLDWKAKLPHGRFRKWVENECGVSIKKAERYMTLAKNRAYLERLDPEVLADLSINAALRMIKGNPSDAYDKAEKKLVEKLGALNADQADACAAETIRVLNEAVAELKRKALPKAQAA